MSCCLSTDCSSSVEANSLERIQSYIDIEHESEAKDGGVPPAYWPASGDIRVENLTARYSPDGPVVLDNLSFHIKAGERVGVVGRTGSGKSTLTLSLLRCIFTDGEMYYDGIPTSSINLDALRSNITIIPQAVRRSTSSSDVLLPHTFAQPELLAGTLRKNLDMFGRHDDAELNDALRSAGLFTLQTEADESRLTLDSQIAGGGGNLSVGQRQIIALARAIVRQSKLLILDEATSAIDYETDAVIQASLRTELKSDVTVICVAHRLQSVIDSDKIVSDVQLAIVVAVLTCSVDGTGRWQGYRVRFTERVAQARERSPARACR
jgi:ABC-type multidrug transport system fused ATPase/permease subunit